MTYAGRNLTTVSSSAQAVRLSGKSLSILFYWPCMLLKTEWFFVNICITGTIRKRSKSRTALKLRNCLNGGLYGRVSNSPPRSCMSQTADGRTVRQ
ncbi:hypothetical protein BO79DRAFT_28165 [Aspergillus costaricaensis CBS 115574]|uniref:Uncharacterized protein n=1 Tax=Aspergillus costaricaensis CBS 115574 TaxID=1448317 RepID=A0ACD1IAB8_9EURO|nr:hypothetical protein BO79DRAFT_28165 [Aspergillus costaricaensis CBS 115574]RAK87507.1 hypothetical protein BO79DRAFT_28165 [Aspergillus costaricaensis CBS 115574]